MRDLYHSGQIMSVPDSKVHGAYMGPTWGRQDPGGSHVGPMNLAIWGIIAVDALDPSVARTSTAINLTVLDLCIPLCDTKVVSYNFSMWYALQWRHYERDGLSISGVSMVCSTVCSGEDQWKHQSPPPKKTKKKQTNNNSKNKTKQQNTNKTKQKQKKRTKQKTEIQKNKTKQYETCTYFSEIIRNSNLPSGKRNKNVTCTILHVLFGPQCIKY